MRSELLPSLHSFQREGAVGAREGVLLSESIMPADVCRGKRVARVGEGRFIIVISWHIDSPLRQKKKKALSHRQAAVTDGPAADVSAAHSLLQQTALPGVGEQPAWGGCTAPPLPRDSGRYWGARAGLWCRRERGRCWRGCGSSWGKVVVLLALSTRSVIPEGPEFCRTSLLSSFPPYQVAS